MFTIHPLKKNRRRKRNVGNVDEEQLKTTFGDLNKRLKDQRMVKCQV